MLVFQKNITSWLSTLINIGITHTHTPDEAHRIRLSNQLALSLLCIDAPYIFIFPLNGIIPLGIQAIICLCSLIFCIILNKTKRYLEARILLIFIVGATLWIACLMTGQETYIQMVFFPLSIIPLLLFERHQKQAMLLSIAYVFICFFSLEISQYQLIPILASYQKLFKNQRIISLTASIAAFIISILSINLFYKSRQRIENDLKQSMENEKLVIKQQKISLELLEKETKEKTEALSKLNESRSLAEELSLQSAYATLTRGIAHEIKNPLQILSGRAEIVLDDLDNKEGVKKFAEVMHRNIKRLKKLIHSMLEYGASSGNDKEIFCINEVVEDIFELSGHKCKENGIELKIESEDSFEVLGNKVFIYQALLNLVVNAIQYTPRKGSITLRCRRKNYIDKENNSRQGVEIAVEDTGIGISEENMKQIFVPYFTSKAQPENTGLGLSMAFKTIAENDGSIEVSSKVGTGTTFKVYLPLASK